MNKLKGRRGKGSSREAKKKKSPRKRTAKRKGEVAFEFLDHPADVGFLARGKTLEELFAAAALALCDYGWRLENVRPREAVEVRVRAASLEDLLYSWLSELLFLTDAEGWVFKRFSVERVEPTKAGGISPPWEVRGRGHGEKFDPERHRARTYIKAVTYHQLAVEQKHGAWVATVYLDV